MTLAELVCNRIKLGQALAEIEVKVMHITKLRGIGMTMASANTIYTGCIEDHRAVALLRLYGDYKVQFMYPPVNVDKLIVWIKRL